MWNSTARMADCQVHHGTGCSSANWNTQWHNIISHGAITPLTISRFAVPPIRPYPMSINAKIGGKDHYQATNGGKS
jgi:hypothetical protein